MKSPNFFLVAGSFVLLGVSAPAALILSESFSYPTGSALLGQSGGTGFTDAWGAVQASSTTQTIAAGITYPSLLTAGGSSTNNTGNGQIVRSFTSFVPTAGSSLFASFLLSQTTVGYANYCFFSSTGTEIISFGDTYNGSAPSPTYSLYRAAGGGGSLYTPSTANVDTTGGTHFVVLRIDYLATGANVSLFLDPAAGGNLNTPIATSTLTGANSELGRVRIENAAGARIDEMRLGTTYADVSPVPEPASGFLAIVGGIGMLTHRRRQA